MSRFTTCGLTILLAFAPVALAADGVVLINQSTMTNGLTGCPTGGHFPIIICQSGSYRLSGSLTVADENTTAINIPANNVSLDLNGFAILGPVTCTQDTFPVQCSATSTTGSGVGILSSGINFSVTNGTVNGMGLGGILVFGNGARIDGLRISNNAGFVGGISANSGVISNCTVTTNAGSGIFLAVGTVDSSHIIFNGGFGIDGEGRSLVATNNSLARNGQNGMNNVLLAVNNTITDNVGFGFSCDDTSCGFQGNVFKGNGGVVNKGTSLGHNLANGLVF